LDSLVRIAGASEERIEWARATMGRQLRGELDAFIEQAAVDTMVLPGYEQLHVDQVRPNTRKSIHALLAVLEGADVHVFGDVLRDVALLRARQGLQPRALFGICTFSEGLVNLIASRCLRGVEELLLGAIIARRICDGAREVVSDAFQTAHLETREAVERLARQFSAPILPALPGVLVLPIVGAIAPTRARQIVDALLDGIQRHGAHTVILDITGLTDPDADLPVHLQRATSTARLLGARVVLAGVSPSVARILVEDAGGMQGAGIHATLASALMAASRQARAPADAWRVVRRP
jgi:anti-anti-sigma regulatory factor